MWNPPTEGSTADVPAQQRAAGSSGRVRLIRHLGLLIAVILGATGCGGPALTTELVMDEFDYQPEEFVLPADTPGYQLQLTNVGEVPHDFSVEGLPDDVLVHLAVFEGASLPYILPALPAGTYTVFCGIDGHRAAGMETVLQVR